MTQEELDKIIEQHKHWLNEDCEGWEDMKADLCDANLCGADLRCADLCGANLRDADLCGAKLCDADLRDADLRDADLCGAKLCGANLRGAKLCGANLRDADLRDADLCGAENCASGASSPNRSRATRKRKKAWLSRQRFPSAQSFSASTAASAGLIRQRLPIWPVTKYCTLVTTIPSSTVSGRKPFSCTPG